MNRPISAIVSLILIFSAVHLEAQTGRFTQSVFGSLEARQIGPAVMSGRITAIDGIENDPKILYVGTAGGGVWKTMTGGTLFKPIFDKYAQSIGALKIDQKNPETVWVGTGESNMRNSVAVGDGIYRTVDGGETWEHMGLEGTQHISRIIIHPSNSDIIYAAAPGPLWGDSEERGLFKTEDGGRTWKKILYLNEATGCADIVISPKNPEIIYAAMWRFRRKPWLFSSGGEGSGLYKSTDGGESWERIDKAFSEDGILGRICLAISPSDPNNIYAIAESRKTGLYSSTDAGKTWTRMSAAGNVIARPFYFSVLEVDPTDSKRIYRPAFSLSISDDGGQSFRNASFEGGWVHADHHAIWINPKNPQNIYLGTDGGVYFSFDRGNNWMFLNNLPVSQFYHAAFDLEKPYYNVYGGLQDNGSWMGPSNSPGGIKASDWKSVGFGDGFNVVPDLSDNSILYWQWQGGNLNMFNRKTNENKDIKPYPTAGEGKLRFNWNTPVYQSPNHPGTIYTGSQYLYRSSNKGDSWEKLSPDLTTNDPEKQKQEESGGLSVDNSSAENHCTIFAICESPLDANLIWAGTDDGNLQVTENGGASWANVVSNIPGLPKNTWCSSVDASRFDRRTAYVTFDGHAGGDMKCYIFKTTDLGKTWRSITTADIKGYAHKIKEDIVKPNLLFAGTVFGLFVTIDGGGTWAKYTSNLPSCEVRDIAVHPETHDVILGTHGRGIIIIDDITPIRNISQDVLNSEAFILPTRQNFLNVGLLGGSFPNQGGVFEGPNSTEDAVITYYLRERAVIGEIKLEIYDASGTLVKSMPASKRKGINRVTWDMRMKPPKVAKGVRLSQGGFVSPLVPEGVYTVKLIKNNKIFTGTMELVSDPRTDHLKDDRDIANNAMMELYRMQEDLAFLVENLDRIKNETGMLLKSGKLDENLGSQLKALAEKCEDLRKTLVATKEGQITGEERLREDLGWVYSQISGYYGRPTDSQLDRVKGLKAELDKAFETASGIFTGELSQLNSSLLSAGMNRIELITREDFDKK